MSKGSNTTRSNNSSTARSASVGRDRAAFNTMLDGTLTTTNLFFSDNNTSKFSLGKFKANGHDYNIEYSKTYAEVKRNGMYGSERNGGKITIQRDGKTWKEFSHKGTSERMQNGALKRAKAFLKNNVK